jgi:F0F1-type ATP synthase membrane subunit c/vacuolar-type H+-ATPase subunit K
MNIRYPLILAVLGTLFITPALAQEESTGLADSSRFFAASVAFSAAAMGAGLAVGRAGSSGLAATAERPEMRTTAIIITALGEAIAIYGIVVAILILGS